MEKYYLFEHLWEADLTYRYIFAVSSLILFPLFATNVVDTGDKFAAGSLTPVANLPPVSTTLAKLVAKFAIGVVDIHGAP
jgi:hypothetical protein